MLLKRVNAHASGVNNLLQFLQHSSNSPIIGIQESKVDVHLMSLCLLLCYHTQFCFEFYIIYQLQLDPFLMDSGEFGINYYAHYVCKYTNYSANFQILWKKLVVISFQDCIISTFLLLYGNNTAPEFHLTFGFFEYFA